MNYDWNSSGIVSVGCLVDCMAANNFLVDSLAQNFMSFCIFDVFQEVHCVKEFDRAIEVVNFTGAANCVEPHLISSAISDIESADFNLVSGLPSPLNALTPEVRESTLN